jgi:RimJ/RimL family protein N-acetyltransferase
MQIRIRAWRSDEAHTLQALADDVDVARWMSGFPTPYTKRDAENWIAAAATHDPPHFFAIEADGVVVGGAGLEPRDGTHRGVAILGYWLGKDYWGRGIASAVVGMLVERDGTPCDELVFGRLLTAGHRSDNE